MTGVGVDFVIIKQGLVMGFSQKFIYSGAFRAYKKRGQLKPFDSFRTTQFHQFIGPIAGLDGS